MFLALAHSSVDCVLGKVEKALMKADEREVEFVNSRSGESLGVYRIDIDRFKVAGLRALFDVCKTSHCQFLYGEVLLDAEQLLKESLGPNIPEGDKIQLGMVTQARDISAEIARLTAIGKAHRGPHIDLEGLVFQLLTDREVSAYSVAAWAMSMNGSYSILLKVLRDWVNVNEYPDGERPLLHLLTEAQNYSNKEMYLNLFFKNGADREIQDSEGNTPLMVAAKTNKLTIVEYLIKQRVNVNALNKNGESALYFSAGARAESEVAKALIAAGADPNIGKNPLINAIEKNSLLMVLFFKEKVRDINVKVKRGVTLLMYLATRWFSSLAKFIERIENINEVDDQGNTALHYAAKVLNLKVVEELIERGAEKNVENNEGETPFVLAEKYSGEDRALQRVVESKEKILEMLH